MTNNQATPPTDSESPEERRLFFAWLPDGDTVVRLREWQSRLGRSKQLDDGIRWLDSAQFHVTATFLGQVPVSLTPSLIDGAHAAATDLMERGVTPEIALDRLMFFPRRSRPRALVIAGPATEALKSWHRSLRLVASQQLPDPGRHSPFKPHVSLGRVTSPKAAGAKLPRLREPLELNSPSFSLVESRLLPGGASHEVLWTFS